MGSPNTTHQQQKTQSQIRKMCKLNCPAFCINNKRSEWEYFDGSEEDNEYYPDGTINLHCIGKIKIIFSK